MHGQLGILSTLGQFTTHGVEWPFGHIHCAWSFIAPRTQGTQNGHSPQDSSHGLWKSPEATSHLREGVSTQDQGDFWHNSMDPSLREPGVDCIVQFEAKYPSHNPFQRKALAPKSYNPWWLPEDHLRTPTPWISRCLLFHPNSILSREYLPSILQGKYQHIVHH
ncbi:hypothetical protein O181_010159 [Austropuccinia psidii MF-1]|uniref:Uncharacterized protein n=1 Tax=Austropuccinia psidii MF-1 TaxID=1389203 RepID=A0A9Q3BQI0_9BASI|nr:hypothetical protein [Austropuccinia psidii MF-1]